MFKKKNLLAIITVLCLLLSSALPTFAAQETKDNSKTFELFTIKDLDKHSDVLKYIEEKGYSKKLQDFTKSNGSDKNNSADKVKAKDVLSEETISRITEKYELTKPESVEENSSESVVLVEKDTENASIAGFVDNVWVLNYAVTDSGFSIGITNFGFDSVDAITGTVTKYGLDG